MLSNYPPGVHDYTPGAPWNEESVPDREFPVTCIQTLRRDIHIVTNNYGPGEYEGDVDTSDTHWTEEYKELYFTPVELLAILKEYAQKDLEALRATMEPNDTSYKVTQARRLEGIIEDCETWKEQEFYCDLAD